jgi:hypothetical protein
METKKPLTPEEVIAQLKKLIESRNKLNSLKNGNELKAPHTAQN